MTLLRDQVAIVTGGGRGLGRAVAETFAALGASVVIASRNAPELDDVVLGIKKSGGRALAQTADVADDRQVQELVLATERWVGPATVLVNNGGTYLPTRAVLPGMLERGAGRIVNISSGAATRPNPGWTAYAASKAGVVQLTKSLALELEGTGVTACTYDPGVMDTEMQERLRRMDVRDFPRAEEYRQLQREGRLIDPKRAARAVAYLALPSTARNGQALSCDDPELVRAVEAALPA